ncbi:transposase [Serratia ureilytica]
MIELYTRECLAIDDGIICVLRQSRNSRLRQECLNENWFMSLGNAQRKIEAWRIHYN